MASVAKFTLCRLHSDWRPTCSAKQLTSICMFLSFAVMLAVFLDVSQNGKLLDAAACIARYPQLAGMVQSQQSQQQAAMHNGSGQVGWLPPSEAPVYTPVLQAPSVVAVWASLARSMVTAHQRRGESDLVAHWLYQLLALDTQAAEWAHVLQ